MQGPIAQAVGLTIFGNDFLHGHPRLDFWPVSRAFAHCKTVAFVNLAGSTDAPNENPFAPDPNAWFGALRDGGVTGLRLRNLPSERMSHADRMTVAFVGGGGRWLIEAKGEDHSDFWDARWRVQDRKDPDKKIWEVTYGKRVADRFPDPAACDVEAFRGDLKTTLAALAAFAKAQQLDSFADCFKAGLAHLGADDPLADLYYRDFGQCRRLSLAGRQLIGVAEAAWVFGGMGSWNDLGFDGEDGKTYAVLSDRLFALLNMAIVEGANTSFVARSALDPR